MEPKTISLKFADGTSSDFTIAPMPVVRFRKAWAAIDASFDELKLLDLAFNQAEGWSTKLTPESYTVATEAMYGICADFFGSVARRQAWRAATRGAIS